MKVQKIELNESFRIKTDLNAFLTVYVPDETASGLVQTRLRPAVLIIPGGGYNHLGRREGEPVAIKFMAAGYIPFVLSYTADGKHGFPVQQAEASLAMAYIREYGRLHNADSEKIAVIGFSAGAHLACSLSCINGEAEVTAFLKGTEYFEKRGFSSIRADVLALCYPVITSDEKFIHSGSFNVLAGGDSELKERLSLEKRIGADFPPTYIWHTATDETVPVGNSLALASALCANNVPFEIHIFERGKHGLSLADKTVYDIMPEISDGVENWFDEAIAFFKAHGVKL